MPGGGSSIYTEAGQYAASFGDMFDLLVLHPRQFHARLTWVELPNLRLLRAQEASSRIAYLRLPPELVFVTFPTQLSASLICGGVEKGVRDEMYRTSGRGVECDCGGAGVRRSANFRGPG
jgi:hypothetical protein